MSWAWRVHPEQIIGFGGACNASASEAPLGVRPLSSTSAQKAKLLPIVLIKPKQSQLSCTFANRRYTALPVWGTYVKRQQWVELVYSLKGDHFKRACTLAQLQKQTPLSDGKNGPSWPRKKNHFTKRNWNKQQANHMNITKVDHLTWSELEVSLSDVWCIC